jgi:hypothetical protein
VVNQELTPGKYFFALLAAAFRSCGLKTGKLEEAQGNSLFWM